MIVDCSRQWCLGWPLTVVAIIVALGEQFVVIMVGDVMCPSGVRIRGQLCLLAVAAAEVIVDTILREAGGLVVGD